MRMLVVAAGAAPDVAAVAALGGGPTDEVVVVASPPAGEDGARESADAMRALESDLLEHDTAGVVIWGDGPAAPAAALVAVKLGVPAVRLGAGVRSGERHAPDEINRVVADRVCDLLLCADDAAAERLRHEGLGERTRLVGDWETDPEPAASAILGWLETYTSHA